MAPLRSYLNLRRADSVHTDRLLDFSGIKPLSMSLSSPAFPNRGFIPQRYAADRSNINPPLSWTGVPSSAKSLVLILEDPDVPPMGSGERLIVHWILFNIPAHAASVHEGSSVGLPGMNSLGYARYWGPTAPPHETHFEHRYFFSLYALDSLLDCEPGVPKRALARSMEEHVIARAQLVARYRRGL